MSAERRLTDREYELLSAYLDGQLSDSERSALEARLQHEPLLRRELEALRQTVMLVNQLPTLRAPRSFALDARIIRPAPSRVLIFPTTAAFSALSAAAAVLLLVLAGYLFLAQPAREFAAPQSIAAEPTTVGDRERALPSPTALVITPTQTASPLAQPLEAGGLAARDESQTVESADAAVSIQQPAPTATPTMTPVAEFAAPAAALEEEAAQGEIAADQLLAPASAPQGTLTTLAYAPTMPASERPTVGQAALTATPELERDDQLSPTMTATLQPTGILPQRGVVEERQQGSDQITAAIVSLAAGIVLLIISAATTLARKQR